MWPFAVKRLEAHGVKGSGSSDNFGKGVLKISNFVRLRNTGVDSDWNYRITKNTCT
jgi:hypothetical protein